MVRKGISDWRVHAIMAATVVAFAVVVAGRSDGVPFLPAAFEQSEAPPAPDAPIPRDPQALAARLADTTRSLDTAIEDWLAEGNPSRGEAPQDVTLLGLYQQRIYLVLGDRTRLAKTVLRLLPSELRPDARDVVAARRALGRLNPPTTRPPRSFKTGRALPAGVLLRHYREAQRRFKVHPRVLAAVNLVETGFNRIRSSSTAGAQGPMQFLPATWRRYGLGGDIHNPHDAILGAANYLRASGAPGDYKNALYHYNPSSLYVTAVLRYARLIRRDPEAFYGLYSWQVFVRTPAGPRQITGPGSTSRTSAGRDP